MIIQGKNLNNFKRFQNYVNMFVTENVLSFKGTHCVNNILLFVELRQTEMMYSSI